MKSLLKAAAIVLITLGVASCTFAEEQTEYDRATIALMTELVEHCKNDQSVQVSIVLKTGQVSQYHIYCEVVAERHLQLPEE